MWVQSRRYVSTDQEIYEYSAGDMWVNSSSGPPGFLYSIQCRRYVGTEQEICEYRAGDMWVLYSAGDMWVQSRRYASTDQEICECRAAVYHQYIGIESRAHNFVTVSGTTVVLIWNLYWLSVFKNFTYFKKISFSIFLNFSFWIRKVYILKCLLKAKFSQNFRLILLSFYFTKC